MQALDGAQNGHALGAIEIGEAAHLASKARVPVDAPARRFDLGDRQQVGMLARQPRGNRRAQLAGGAPQGIARQASAR